jgi:hypothetical protein
MNYDNVVRFAFTHPDNQGKSIREIAGLLGLNPGSVYRILTRLGLVEKPPKRGFHRPDPPDEPRTRPAFHSPILTEVIEELSLELPCSQILKK